MSIALLHDSAAWRAHTGERMGSPQNRQMLWWNAENSAKLMGFDFLAGYAAAFIAVKAGLSPHEHFKRTVAAVHKVHCGCTSFQIWAEKNAVDFSQNLRRGRMQKGMLPLI